MSEHCVFCGQEIPEGRQLCPTCEKNVDCAVSAHASAGMTYTEAVDRIKAVENMISNIAAGTVFSFDQVLALVDGIAREALSWKAVSYGSNVVDMACEKIKRSIRADIKRSIRADSAFYDGRKHE